MLGVRKKLGEIKKPSNVNPIKTDPVNDTFICKYSMNVHQLKKSKYYRMSVKKSNVTYLHTGDVLPEGEYCVYIRGLLKNKDCLHTIIAGVIPYTGNTHEIILNKFSLYDHIIVISVTEAPQFSIPSESFFKIIHRYPCATLPEHY